MASLNDEQQSELEALAAIYGEDLTSTPPSLAIRLLPDATGSSVNHVGVNLSVTFTPDYPASAPPALRLEVIKGLKEDQIAALTKLAEEAAAANLGMPAIYAIAEEIRTWLQENNQPPDEGSAFDEMMKRQRAKEKGETAGSGVGATSKYAAFSKEADPSLAAARGNKVVLSAKEEDETIRRKREGTPVTVESFMAWRAKFDLEMAQKKAEEAAAAAVAAGQKGTTAAATVAEMAARLTGRQLFERDATLATSDEAAEDAAAARAAASGGAADGSEGPAGFVVDEGLFGDEEDDLDDLEDDEDDDEDYEGEDDDEDDDDDDEFVGDDSDEDEDAETAGAKGGKEAKAGAGGGKR